MPKENIKFYHMDSSHITYCKRKHHNKVYLGKAKCHPNDYDFESPKIGEHYAYVRSLISQMRDNRDNLRHDKKVYYHLLSIYGDRPEFEPAVHMIYRQIKSIDKQLNFYKDLITETNNSLHAEMTERDAVHATFRKYRAEGVKKYSSEEVIANGNAPTEVSGDDWASLDAVANNL